MKKCIQVIGSVVFSILLFAAPILATCSIILRWAGFFQMLFFVIGLVELIFVSTLIYDEVLSDD